MLINDLPQDIKDVVIKHHIEQRRRNELTHDSLVSNSFTWSETPERRKIWSHVDNGNFKPFRQFHHNQLKPGDTVEYFKPIELADWNEFGISPILINFKLGDKLKIEDLSDDEYCTVQFKESYSNYPSHCFRKVEAVEEPQRPFKAGDRVRIKKEFFNLFNSDDLQHDTFVVKIVDKFSCFRPHSLQDNTIKNVISLAPTYGGFYLAECFELHVEQPKEEPVKEPIEDFKVGDKVVYYRVPTEKDWHGIGAVSIEFTIGSELTILSSSSRNKSLKFKEEIAKGLNYPASCFRKVTEQKEVLNPIHQHYEYGGKIREKFWNKEEWIKKYSETHSIDNGNTIGDDYLWSFKSKPEDWEIFVEEDDKRTSKKIISVSETTLSEVPEYWYFPLDDCTTDELIKFQKFKEDKASSYKDFTIRNHYTLLNFHWDKSYYYTDPVEELIKETWFHSSAVKLRKEEFYRLIYNPWQERIESKKENSNDNISISPKEEIRPISPDHKLILLSKNKKKKLLLESYNDLSINVHLKKSKS